MSDKPLLKKDELRLKQTVLMRTNQNKSTIILHRKKFLQPFEKKLAKRELEGLEFQVVSQNEKSNVFTIRVDNKDKSRLISRLAYFDWMASDVFQPTLQACREGANPLANNNDQSFPKRRVLRFGPHDFHEYRGKFFPQLVRSICNIVGLEEDSLVFDPMCGSGTTIVETRALNLHAYGLDRNPLSILIADVKTRAIGWDDSKINEIKTSLESTMKHNPSNSELPWQHPDLAYLKRWFAQESLDELSGLISQINLMDNEDARRFALVCLSDILRSVSYQKGEDLRVRKHIRQYHKGEATKLLLTKIEENLKSITWLNKVDPNHKKSYRLSVGDARFSPKYFRSEIGKMDAIITSPPYATALPYLDTDRLSLIVLGLLPRPEHKITEIEMIGTREITEKQRKEWWQSYLEHKDELPRNVRIEIDKISTTHHGSDVGFRRRNLPALLSRYFLDMKKVIEGMKIMLKHGSSAFIVIGNNSTRFNGTQRMISTDEFIEDIAKEIGFEIVSKTNMELLVSRDIFKNNRGSRETIIQLVKP